GSRSSSEVHMGLARGADLWFPHVAREMRATTSTDAEVESVDELIARVAQRLNRAGTIANVVGIFDTFLAVGFILPTVIGEPETYRLGWIDGPIVALLAIAVPLIGRRIDRELLEPSRRWLAA